MKLFQIKHEFLNTPGPRVNYLLFEHLNFKYEAYIIVGCICYMGWNVSLNIRCICFRCLKS